MTRASIFAPIARCRDAGNAMIELTLALPLLVLLVGGALAYGQLLYEKRVLAEASYVGTLAAARLPAAYTPLQVESAVNNVLQNFLTQARLKATDYTWRFEDFPSAVGSLRCARITIGPRSSAVFSIFGHVAGGTTCSQSTVMLAEGSPATDYANGTTPTC